MVLARRVAKVSAAVAVVAMLGWLGGFAWFVLRATRPEIAPPAHADGIVALTGGAGRVEAAMRLLADGRADRLLVSGTGGGAEIPELAKRAGVDAASLAGRVTLGRDAATTLGNAIETERWTRQHGVRTLIVVTSGYHMPRALAEIARAAPDVALYPWVVMPAGAVGADGIPTAASLRLFAEEFTKWLLVRGGLATLVRPAALIG